MDSVNLSPAVGKVTDRDRMAVHDLIDHTDWLSLPDATQELLELDSNSNNHPNTDD